MSNVNGSVIFFFFKPVNSTFLSSFYGVEDYQTGAQPRRLKHRNVVLDDEHVTLLRMPSTRCCCRTQQWRQHGGTRRGMVHFITH